MHLRPEARGIKLAPPGTQEAAGGEQEGASRCTLPSLCSIRDCYDAKWRLILSASILIQAHDREDFIRPAEIERVNIGEDQDTHTLAVYHTHDRASEAQMLSDQRRLTSFIDVAAASKRTSEWYQAHDSGQPKTKHRWHRL